MINNKKTKTLTRFKKLFSTSNFTTKQGVQISGITQAEFTSVLKANGIDVSLCAVRGLITLWRGEQMLSNTEIKELI